MAPARSSRKVSRMKSARTFLSFCIAALLRLLAKTWHLHVNDQSGITGSETLPPAIWVLWHNRLIVVPILYTRFFRHRKGAALISRSKDGELLARCIERFGGVAVRGSSSNGGAAALAELKEKMAAGFDSYITPDGPRGPRYHVAPGVLWLARSTGAPLLPMSMECSACWRLGRWDAFIIPKPFAKVEVTLHPFYKVGDLTGDAAFESERERLRITMLRQTKRV